MRIGLLTHGLALAVVALDRLPDYVLWLQCQLRVLADFVRFVPFLKTHVIIPHVFHHCRSRICLSARWGIARCRLMIAAL